MTRRLHMAILLVLLHGSAACTRPDPEQVRIQGLKKRLSTLLSESSVKIRFNPAECSCPAYELKLDDTGWVRVQIEDESDPDDAERPAHDFMAKAREDHERGLRATYDVHLALEESSPSACANGTLFFSVAVTPPPE